MRLQDITAVVTGGDTGIGRAISLAMVRDGARVVIDYEGDEARAVELAPHAITVNNICPGAIHATMHAGPETDDEEFEILLDEIPLHRMGTPEEVAELCMYLASPAASYVTGASYLIDGGMTKTSSSF